MDEAQNLTYPVLEEIADQPALLYHNQTEGAGNWLELKLIGVKSVSAATSATWSSVWYLLSSYAVISYTENWVYVAFAAIGSWLGAFVSITFLHRPPGGPPIGAAPE